MIENTAKQSETYATLLALESVLDAACCLTLSLDVVGIRKRLRKMTGEVAILRLECADEK